MIVDKVKNLKKCRNCKEIKLAISDNFYFQKGKAHGVCKKCSNSPEKKKYRNEYSRRLRLSALVFYGGEIPKCSCCGETEKDFLGIDHVNGGGNKHRKEMKAIGITIYLWLRKNGYPDGFQVLCHNCNLSKGYYGECPHKRLIKK